MSIPAALHTSAWLGLLPGAESELEALMTAFRHPHQGRTGGFRIRMSNSGPADDGLDCSVAYAPRKGAIRQACAFPPRYRARVVRPIPPRMEGSRECRVLAAPAALCANERSTQASHHGYAATSRHSLHDGFTACFALFPVSVTS
jgi:hypothetical protein